jgi:hypothetical protein
MATLIGTAASRRNSSIAGLCFVPANRNRSVDHLLRGVMTARRDLLLACLNLAFAFIRKSTRLSLKRASHPLRLDDCHAGRLQPRLVRVIVELFSKGDGHLTSEDVRRLMEEET